LKARFVGGAGYYAPARLTVRVVYDEWQSISRDFEVLIAPRHIPAPAAVEVLDGRTMTFSVFRQKGNQGGGAAISRTVTEGKGNGNGVLEPGEAATIWVKIPQGLDPFDRDNWHRTKVRSESRWLTEAGDIQEDKQREWTGARARTSLVRLAPDTPAGTAISAILDNETWSFHFTPGVRYGEQPLYQAFQLHRPHLHRWEMKSAAAK
jgi:hypothetical protein